MPQSSKRILRERAAACGLNDDGGCSPWLVLAVMGGVTLWIWYSLGSPAGGIGLVAAMGIVFTLSGKADSLRLRRLAGSRAGESICQFARSFERRSTDSVVIRAVFERLQKWIGFRGFPVRSSDDVFKDYRMDGLDFDDLVQEVSDLTGRPLAKMKNNPYYGRVEAAGDLVRFFCHQPRCQILNLQS